MYVDRCTYNLNLIYLLYIDILLTHNTEIRYPADIYIVKSGQWTVKRYII